VVLAGPACADDTGSSRDGNPPAVKEPARAPITTGANPYPETVGRRDRPDPNGSLSEQFNTLLPRWLRLTGELRERFEGYSGGGFKPNATDDYDLHRLRLGIQIRPVSWLRLFAEAQDARVWGKSPALPPNQNTFDLRRAYVELGNTEESGFSVRAGRQELNFGNARLIGESWWSNVSRSFDGVRATFRQGKIQVDTFAASVVIVRDGVLDHHNPGNPLYGVYGTIKDWIPRSILEPYELWHLESGVATEEGKPGHLDQHTTGFRFVGTLPANFDYRTEMGVQRGQLGAERIRAWTGHWVMGYTLAHAPTSPRIFLEYDYASGDRAIRDGQSNTWDPMYYTTHDKLGLADQFGWRNIKDLRLGSEYRMGKRWTLASSFHDFWLASAADALYPARGPIIARSATGMAGTHVGEEFDVQTVYRPTRQTQFGFGYGHIFTGEFLNKTTPGKDYNYPYMLADYVF